MLAERSDEERDAIAAEAEQIRTAIAHYRRTLAEVRRARTLTQETMAEALGTSQGEVSRVENASDLYLSTLARYVSAMGGELSLVARFGDDDPVTLAVGHVCA